MLSGSQRAGLLEILDRYLVVLGVLGFHPRIERVLKSLVLRHFGFLLFQFLFVLGALLLGHSLLGRLSLGWTRSSRCCRRSSRQFGKIERNRRIVARTRTEAGDLGCVLSADLNRDVVSSGREVGVQEVSLLVG